jgi:hypothetical protein
MFCQLSWYFCYALIVHCTCESQRFLSHLHNSAQLSLPQLNRLFEASFVRDESSASTADVAVIPSQHKVTDQTLSLSG